MYISSRRWKKKTRVLLLWRTFSLSTRQLKIRVFFHPSYLLLGDESFKIGNGRGSYSDMISDLPHDLLFRILSFIPVRDVISTRLLSKRWKFLWKIMPTLDLDEDSCPTNIGSLRFDKFCGMYLKSHEAQILTSLNLTVKKYTNGIDCLLSNIQSTLLEMTITSYSYSPITFPKYLNVYQTLVVMKLQNNIVVDVLTPVCFRSLKSLHLTRVKYSRKESFSTLLSACPVLEDLDLFIERVRYECLDSFTIFVPSLQRLSICEESFFIPCSTSFFEINVPSLKYFKIAVRQNCFMSVEGMPKLVEAHVELDHYLYLLIFLTSVERLSIHFLYSTVTLSSYLSTIT